MVKLKSNEREQVLRSMIKQASSIGRELPKMKAELVNLQRQKQKGNKNLLHF